MTKYDNKNTDLTDERRLDAIFARARVEQHDFDDENFIKMVTNRLPVKPHRVHRKQYYFDVIGIFVGILVAYFVIEPRQLMIRVFSLLPSDISVSLTSMLFMSLALSSMALAAWWTIEQNSSS